MRLYFWVFIISTVLMLSVFFGLIANSIGELDPVPSEVAAGKRVWQEKGCVECHTVFGNGGYSAIDVTKVISLHGLKRVEKFFLEPPVMRPGETSKHMGLNRQETREMIAYLKFLNRIPNQAWPPSPVKPIPEQK